MATAVQDTTKRSRQIIDLSDESAPKQIKKAKSAPAAPLIVFVVVYFVSEFDSGSDYRRSRYTKENYDQSVLKVFRSRDDANRFAIDYMKYDILELDSDDDEDEDEDGSTSRLEITYDGNGCVRVDEAFNDGEDERHTRVEVHTVD
eukprot:TRINITY_DN1995_c1_g2_i1.p1 TRINITY_DN1995_c1_g2~~TRINITY_DN1995_c1_g2_i1.p1  ORF type:complete len:156 (-),score=31.24 TRINITY_DN1995_c1_g2_i1:171-608(-)